MLPSENQVTLVAVCVLCLSNLCVCGGATQRHPILWTPSPSALLRSQTLSRGTMDSPHRGNYSLKCAFLELLLPFICNHILYTFGYHEPFLLDSPFFFSFFFFCCHSTPKMTEYQWYQSQARSCWGILLSYRFWLPVVAYCLQGEVRSSPFSAHIQRHTCGHTPIQCTHTHTHTHTRTHTH